MRAARFSSCSDTLLHGAFSQGAEPSVAAYVSPEGNVAVAVVHGTYTGNDPHVCGKPLSPPTETETETAAATDNDGKSKGKSSGGGGSSGSGILLDGWSFRIPT